MKLKINKKNPLVWIYTAGVLLLLVGVWLWCTKISMDPERVFWSTIERGLTTRGVTIQAEQNNSGTSVKQTVQYSLGGTNLAHSLTELSQAGTTVRNEMIATPTADYSRYQSITTNQKKADGSNLDFSKVIGVWAKGQEGVGQLFSQTVFGSSLPVGGLGVPIANMPETERSKLIQQIRQDDVYQLLFDKVKKTSERGRVLYTYEVTIQPVAYAKLMKQFAKNMGLHSLDHLEPDQFKGQKPFALQITVDARARQVVRVTAPESKLKQEYVSYDVPVQLVLPTNTITGQELQKRLAELQ